MDWEHVERELERAFTGRPRRYGAAIVIERREPFALAVLLDEALSDDERDEHGSPVDWPGSVPVLLEENGLTEQRLLSFMWDGLGPTSWEAGLVVIGAGSRRYLCFWDERDSYQALASIDPWQDELALQGTVARVLNRNGDDFGLTLMGALPPELTNHAPGLLPAATVKQSLFHLMQELQRTRHDAWALLEHEHQRHLEEPDPAQRGYDVLTDLANLVENDGIHSWIEQLEADSTAMPDHERQRLLDDWFAATYQEEAS